MKNRALSLFVMALAVGITTLISMPAKANITITPTIVVIEGRQRYADVYVVNQTDQRQSYELAWKFSRMKEGTGSYIPETKSLTDFDLTKNVVFTPRRVVIEPKGMQKVRVALRLQGAPPPPGDYRAHMLLMNKADTERAPSTEVLGRSEIQPSVGMSVGFSIPVIYRVGDTGNAGGKIGDIKTEINPKTNKIEAVIPITRNPGAHGAIGVVTVEYNGQRVGQVANANIFSEINSRVFRIPLSIQTLSGGNLVVTYSGDTKKEIVYDQKSVAIGR